MSKQHSLFTRVSPVQADRLIYPNSLQHVLSTAIGHEVLVRSLKVECGRYSMYADTASTRGYMIIAEIEIPVEGAVVW